MAISWTHYQLLKSLQPLLPKGGTLLEIGEANWYGDCEPDFYRGELLPLTDENKLCNFLGNSCKNKAVAYCPVDSYNTDLFCEEHAKQFLAGTNRFEIVKTMYRSLFAPSRILSVDLNGTPQASKFDLNQPIPLRGTYDVVINHGTAEHVFNIGQVFRTMHDKTKVGGLMIHEAPFTGWLDHGFYCLQPTLFFDLVAANCYQLVKMAIEEIRSRTIIEVSDRDDIYRLEQADGIPDNSMVFVAFTKMVDEPFRLPLQGYYNQSLSEEGEKAWAEMR